MAGGSMLRQGLARARSAASTMASAPCDGHRRDFGMADPTRLKRTAMRHWLAGCCAVGVSLAFGAQAYGAVSMMVATNDGVQGASLTLTWSLTRTATDPVVAGAGLDIIFDTTQMQLAGSCAKDPRLTQQGLSAELPTFPPVPAAHQRLRLGVFVDPQHPNASFDSG